jgi:FtsP/CotA-like multicopper oxidase with cupredoxin domain
LGLAGAAAFAASGKETASPMPPGMAHPNPTQYTGARPAPTERQAPDAPDPMQMLTAFDYGKVSRLPNGQTQREYTLTAFDREIEVARGVKFPAWTINGTVPGPTLRCTEGDRLVIRFRNEGVHPHTIHLHGIHPANADGVFEIVPPGGSYDYALTAEPFGVFLYHCHVMPLKKHIHKGLYGAFIVDPKTPRPPAKEMVMVMNGFDTDLDGENEFYAVNTIANYFADHPIPLGVGEPVRIYLVNLLEFDLINSFHLHGNVFKLYRTGTSLTQYEITDTVMLCQGERCVLEFTYNHPGRFMFHAHQSEFAELGWMGMFDVRPQARQA